MMPAEGQSGARRLAFRFQDARTGAVGLFDRLRMYSTASVRYWALLAIPLCLLLLLERNFWGFVQDDAYICLDLST